MLIQGVYISIPLLFSLRKVFTKLYVLESLILGHFCFVKIISEGKAKPGQTIFITSGIFTIPKGVKEIECFLVGGGGGSYAVNQWTSHSSNGGGGGYTKTEKLSVRPGDEINITIGSGGGVQTNHTNPAGGSSIVDNIAVSGGYGTSGWSYLKEGNGGSGGGRGGGGSDGSNGYGYSAGGDGLGLGQGTTTRAFKEADGTLYAGGGGSGRGASAYPGGEGGGENGSRGTMWNEPGFGPVYGMNYGSAGGINTGGGGGGGCNGGSGIAIIRWGY